MTPLDFVQETFFLTALCVNDAYTIYFSHDNIQLLFISNMFWAQKRQPHKMSV